MPPSAFSPRGRPCGRSDGTGRVFLIRFGRGGAHLRHPASSR